MRRRWVWPALLVIVPILSACAEPPHKEMDQAQGAIDAAKAVGADVYATTEYAAAVDALKRSHDAVAQGDYRLALNHALDSGERAREAARAAADTKAQLRGEVERALTDVDALFSQVEQRLAAAQTSRVARRIVRDTTSMLADVKADLQKARAATKVGDYLTARPLLLEIRGRLEKGAASLNAATTSQPQRRRR